MFACLQMDSLVSKNTHHDEVAMDVDFQYEEEENISNEIQGKSNQANTTSKANSLASKAKKLVV